jgi:hypothetical protein
MRGMAVCEEKIADGNDVLEKALTSCAEAAVTPANDNTPAKVTAMTEGFRMNK